MENFDSECISLVAEVNIAATQTVVKHLKQRPVLGESIDVLRNAYLLAFEELIIYSNHLLQHGLLVLVVLLLFVLASVGAGPTGESSLVEQL